MRWLLGVDLGGTDHGAIGFAAWLHRRIGGDVRALHVLEEAALRFVLKDAPYDRAEVEFRRLASASLERAGASELFEDVLEIVVADQADEELARDAQRWRADALVLGRLAASKGRGVVRLGPVARRLLRTLPVPVIVAPPDLQPDAIGSGPIILATDLKEHSEGAVRFARAVGAALDRPVAAMFVVPEVTAYAAEFVPSATFGQLHAQLRLDGERNLRGWAREHGLGDAPQVVALGDAPDRVMGVAAAENAALIVTGSRRLGLAARFFRASVGTALAANADRAVAVVPTDWQPAGATSPPP